MNKSFILLAFTIIGLGLVPLTSFSNNVLQFKLKEGRPSPTPNPSGKAQICAFSLKTKSLSEQVMSTLKAGNLGIEEARIIDLKLRKVRDEKLKRELFDVIAENIRAIESLKIPEAKNDIQRSISFCFGILYNSVPSINGALSEENEAAAVKDLQQVLRMQKMLNSYFTKGYGAEEPGGDIYKYFTYAHDNQIYNTQSWAPTKTHESRLAFAQDAVTNLTRPAEKLEIERLLKFYENAKEQLYKADINAYFELGDLINKVMSLWSFTRSLNIAQVGEAFTKHDLILDSEQLLNEIVTAAITKPQSRAAMNQILDDLFYQLLEPAVQSALIKGSTVLSFEAVCASTRTKIKELIDQPTP